MQNTADPPGPAQDLLVSQAAWQMLPPCPMMDQPLLLPLPIVVTQCFPPLHMCYVFHFQSREWKNEIKKGDGVSPACYLKQLFQLASQMGQPCRHPYLEEWQVQAP